MICGLVRYIKVKIIVSYIKRCCAARNIKLLDINVDGPNFDYLMVKTSSVDFLINLSYDISYSKFKINNVCVDQF